VVFSAVLADETVSEELKQSLVAQATGQATCGAGSINLSGLTKPAGGSNQDYKCVQVAGDEANSCPDKSYDYYMNVCSASTSGPDCSPKGFGICQYITGSMTFVASLGTWGNAQWTAPTSSQVVATITDGDRCYMQGEWITRTSKITFNCGGSTSPYFKVNEELNTCIFNIALNANCGGGSSGGGGDGISGGLVFIIILLVCVPIYVVVGCIYKAKTKGTNGMESCPNIDFWRDLPGLVKDGFRFTFSKCRGGGSYSQV